MIFACRILQPVDLPDFQQLHQDRNWVYQASQLSAGPGKYYLGCFEREVLVGSVGFGRSPEPRADTGVLIDLLVAEKYRKKGAGQCLVNKLIELLSTATNFRQLRLVTAVDNHGAINLYKKCGFVSLGSTEGDLEMVYEFSSFP